MESRTVIRRSGSQVLSACERAALGFMFVASIVVALAALPGTSPALRTPVAIVFPPWISGAEAVARSIAAGHLVLRSGRSAFVVIAATAGAEAGRPQGAVLVLALSGLAGCLDVRVPDVAG